MDDLKDQSAVSTTATNGVVESEEVRAQEASLWKRGGVLAAAIETPFTASALPSVLNNIFLLFIDLSFLDLEMIFLPKSLR